VPIALVHAGKYRTKDKINNTDETQPRKSKQRKTQ